MKGKETKTLRFSGFLRFFKAALFALIVIPFSLTYTFAADTYTVSYYDGDTQYSTITEYETGDTITLYKPEHKEGKIFAGWCVGSTSCNDNSALVGGAQIDTGTTSGWPASKVLYARWADDKFQVTTTPDTNSFSFEIGANGTFYVDCGEGGTLSGSGVSGTIIKHLHTSNSTYNCSYETAGQKVVRFGGLATSYYSGMSRINNLLLIKTISFRNNPHVSSLSGNLSAIFQYVGSTIEATTPVFWEAFKGCTNLTSIPSTLFENYTAGSLDMFLETFSGCTSLTSIPDDLFASFSAGAGGQNMFAGTFMGCTSLTSLPKNLFANFTSAYLEIMGMFGGTFKDCSNLSGYIPPTLFAGLIANRSPDTRDFMKDIFSGTALDTVCPHGTVRYPTNYDSYWSGKVSCTDQLTCNPGYYLPADTMECTICPTGRYCPGGTYRFNADEDEGVYGCLAGYYESGNNCLACGVSNSAECYTGKFAVKTINLEADDTFTFTMSAAGTFQVDCGADGVLSSSADDVSGNTITRDDTTVVTYTCTSSTGGEKLITFDGVATGYSDSRSPAIPAISFENNTKIASLTGSLSALFPTLASGINTAYPSNKLPSFVKTFYGCTGLTSINGGLFAGYTTGAYSMFSQTFYGCSRLTSIPSNLFAGIEIGTNSMFSNTFSYCARLSSIPSDLFANIKSGASYTFNQTFYGCTGLSSLPENLFINISNVVSNMFSGTFQACTGLRGFVPSSLFRTLIAKGSPNATDLMKKIFYNTGLSTSCPEGFQQYTTNYEGYWGDVVSCTDGVICAAGEYVDGDSCSACGVNSSTYTGNIVETCTCNAGYFSATNETTSKFGCPLVKCEATNYLPAGKSTCEPCPVGYYCAGGMFDTEYNSTPQGLTDCVAGYYRDGDACVQCGPNSSTPANNNIGYCTCDDGCSADGTKNGAKTSINGCSLVEKFAVTTTNLAENDTFSFGLSAKGTFYVDCGDDGVLSGSGVSGTKITRTNTGYATYTCSYVNPGVKTIRFGGATPTGYAVNISAISFTGNTKVESLSGDLSAMFPYLESGAKPRFTDAFNGCTSLKSIPSTLFSGYTTGAGSLFYRTFSGCTGLTSLPESLFANITTAESFMFAYTFENCTGLRGYVPASMFKGLVENGSPYASNLMNGIFDGSTGLDKSCPSGTIVYPTDYEGYWYFSSGVSNHTVACEPAIVCNAGTYLPKNETICLSCPTGKTCPGGTFTQRNFDQGVYSCTNTNGNDECYDWKFAVETSNLNAGDTLSFWMSAKGEFVVDCGDGGMLSGSADDVSGNTITRTNTNLSSYTCTYSTGGEKLITFDGEATGYNTTTANPYQSANSPNFVAAISFTGNTKIVGLRGNLATLLPPLGTGNGDIPRFFWSFAGTNVTSIDENLFNGYEVGTPGMFYYVFRDCFALTYLPERLFATIKVLAHNMFRLAFYADSGLRGYIPPSMFAGLVENGSPQSTSDTVYFMSGIFNGAYNLLSSCPDGMRQYITGYESEWSGRVSCTDGVVCAAGEYVDGDSCSACGVNSSTYAGNIVETCNCDAGYFSATNETTSKSGCPLIQCSATNYLPAGETTCKPCPTGYYCPGGIFDTEHNSAPQGLTDCAAGYHRENDVCVPCKANDTDECFSGKFAVKTTNLSENDNFSFSMSAKGTFQVDCGTGGVLSSSADDVSGNTVTRNDTTNTTYTCTYSTGGEKLITFDGVATGYNISTSPYVAAISFANNTKVASLAGDLSAVFPSLGSANGMAPRFYQTFAGCTNLTSISSGLFAKITISIKGLFQETFKNCTALTEIPGDLFMGVKYGASNMFNSTFYGCSRLLQIPADLFSNITTGDYEMFLRTFMNCSSLTEIPEDLFASIKTHGFYMFRYTFYGCNSLKSLPNNLFANVTQTGSTMFNGTFSDCYDLSGYIPASLFKGLIEEGSPDDRDFMSYIFYKTNLSTSCPEGFQQYTTGYEGYWGDKVSCTDGIICANGEYLKAGQTECSDCPVGEHCPGGVYYSSDSDQGIIGCAANYYKDGDTCVPCGAHSSTNKGNFAETCNCASNFVSLTGESTSTTGCPKRQCSATYYLPANSTTCAACPTGYYCNGGAFNTENNETDQGLTSCARNYFRDADNKCVACGVNSYTVNKNNGTACTCNSGTYSSTGASTSASGCPKITCVAGTYLPAGKTICETCPVGYYCAGGIVDTENNESDQGLTSCSENYYRDGDACVACGENSMTPNNNNATSCSCVANYYNDGDACVACGVHSSTPSSNTLNACACDEEYTSDGTVSGSATSTNGCSFAGRFSITTTNLPAQNEFKFQMSASGSFLVDCGVDGILSGAGVSGNTITRSGTTVDTYTCTYSTSGQKTILFSGKATGYTTTEDTATISFADNTMVESIAGNISGMFPYLGSTAGKFPRFYETFKGCTNLRTIPDTLFITYKNGADSMFRRLFKACTSLTEIPEDLFATITTSADGLFRGVFSGCTGLTKIPEKLFSFGGNNVPGKALMFAGAFEESSSLTSIPSGLFAHITSGATQMFYSTFGYCTGLGTDPTITDPIPSDLFANITSGAQQIFKATFHNCTGLKKIPEGLFSFGGNNIPGRTLMFQATFSNCTGLGTDPSVENPIPSNLFGNVISGAEKMFLETFASCTGLTKLPSDMFSFGGNNVSGQKYMFSSTFRNCQNLKSIPEGLFAHIVTPADYMFEEVFYGCGGLSGTYIPPTLFWGLITNGSPKATGIMRAMLYNTNMLQTCPNNTKEFDTGYDFGGFVSCTTGAVCIPGTYLPAGSTECTQCKEGKYCPGGEYALNNDSDQGIDSSCGAGYYKDGDNCFECGVNSTTPSNNFAESCTCNTGFFTATGESSGTSGCPKVTCPLGTYLPVGEKNCEPCPEGYYCAGGLFDVQENNDAQGLTSCANNYYDMEGTCISCPEQFPISDGTSGCYAQCQMIDEVCPENSTCAYNEYVKEDDKDFYTPETPTRNSCQFSVVCESNHYKEDNKCLSCPEQFPISDGVNGCYAKCPEIIEKCPENSTCVYNEYVKEDGKDFYTPETPTRASCQPKVACDGTYMKVEEECMPKRYSITYYDEEQNNEVQTEIEEPKTRNLRSASIPGAKSSSVSTPQRAASTLNGLKSVYVYGEGLTLQTPEKKHYTFSGWKDDKDNIVTEISATDSGDKAFYATWTPVPYTLSFESNTNQTYQTKSYNVENYADVVNLPALPVARSGYTSRGWYTSSDYSGLPRSSFTSDMVGLKTLYANVAYSSCGTGYTTQSGAVLDPAIVHHNVYVPLGNDLSVASIDGANLPLIYGTSAYRGQWGLYIYDQEIDGPGIAVYGNAKCKSNIGTKPSSSMKYSEATTAEIDAGATGSYCWCHMDKYVQDEEMVTTETTPWVFVKEYNSVNNCEKTCSKECATFVDRFAFLTQLFGNHSICSLAEYDITLERNNHGTWPNNETPPSKYTVLYHDITIPALDDSNEEHHTFVGWCDNPELTGSCPRTVTVQASSAENKTFYAKWLPDEYSITYVIDPDNILNETQESMIENSNPNTYTYDDSIALNDLSLDGFRFLGWFKDFDGTTYGNTILDFEGADYAEDITLYARWTPATYNISYFDGDIRLDDLEPDLYSLGHTTALPEPPAKTYYNFAGWCLDEPNCSQTVRNIDETWARDIELYAKWTPKTYGLGYNCGKISIGGEERQIPDVENNENGEIQDAVTYGETYHTSQILENRCPTIPGFNFEWNCPCRDYEKPEGGEGSGGAGGAGSGTVKPLIWDSFEGCVGTWTPILYPVGYELNGSELAPATNHIGNPVQYTANTDITLQEPSRPHYTFNNWYEDSTNHNESTLVTKLAKQTLTWDLLLDPVNGLLYDPDKLASYAATLGTKTLYATWTPDSYPIQYYDYLGQPVELSPENHVFGTTTTLPTKQDLINAGIIWDHHDFVGWYDNADYTGNAITEIPAGSFTTNGEPFEYYGKWDLSSYKINYLESNGDKVNGMQPETYTYGFEGEVPTTNPTGNNYFSFVGWCDDSNVDEKTATECPQKRTISATDDVEKTFYAKWEQVACYDWQQASYTDGKLVCSPKQLNITYKNGDIEIQNVQEKYKTFEAHAVEDLLPLSADISTGYRFIGWCDADSTSCTTPIMQTLPSWETDKVLNAVWELIQYPITYEPNGGTVSGEYRYDVEHLTLTLPTPVWSGHVFQGWCDDEDATVNCVKGTKTLPDGTIGPKTFYASWLPSGETCDSGYWLHVGDAKACLSPTKTVPSLAIMVKPEEDPYYLRMTQNPNLKLNAEYGSKTKLRIKHGNKIYNVHDDSISAN